MQDQQFENLVNKVQERAPSTMRDTIRREFEAVRDNGHLLTLDAEEVSLLEAYRAWKRTSDAAGGAFHWKKGK